MSRRGKAAIALVLAALLGGAAGTQVSTPATTPQLTLNVTVNGVLEILLPNGTSVRAGTTGATIPAGSYIVIVNNDVPDFKDVAHMLDFAGPGVTIQTDMGAGDNKTESYAETLAPNATYAFQDDRQPNVARVTISTTAASATSTTSTAGSTTTTSTSGGTSSNTSVVGSKAPFRGALAASVGSTGTAALLRSGKTVDTLKPGRYKITVDDRSPKAGFTLTRAGGPTLALTTPPFLGKQSVTVNLKAGTWTYSSSSRPKQSFSVAP